MVQQRGDVRLNNKEEEFLRRDGEERGAHDGVGWVCPDIVADEVAIPRDGGDDGDGDEDGGLVPVPSCEQRVGQDG